MKTIVLMTGVPASGKTRLMSLLVEEMSANSLRVGVVNDYGLFKQWTEIDGNDRFFVPVEDTFDLSGEAYQFVSAFAAEKLAAQMVGILFDEDSDIGIVEGARGAGSPRDSYVMHFAGPIVSALDGNLNDVRFINIEVRAPDTETLLSRGELRLAEDSEAPPADLYEKYVNDEGNPVLSATEELGAWLPESLLVMNVVVENNWDRDDGMRDYVIDILYPEIADRLGLPRSKVEGQLGTGSPEQW